MSCAQIEDRLILGGISHCIDLLVKSRVTSIHSYSYNDTKHVTLSANPCSSYSFSSPLVINTSAMTRNA